MAGHQQHESLRTYIRDKRGPLRRLHRVEGQVRGVQRMVASDASCVDTLTQISAVTKALEAVALELVDDHLRSCIERATTASPAELDAEIAAATTAIAGLVHAARPRPAGRQRLGSKAVQTSDDGFFERRWGDTGTPPRRGVGP